MANVFPAPPSLDSEKIVSDFNVKSNISSFSSYGVGITDVEEKYIDWKYTRNYKFKEYYRDFYNQNDASKVYEKFKEFGYQDLGDDSVDDNRNTITKVFIVRVPSN